MSINKKNYPLIVRIYLFTNEIFQKSLILLESCFVGFWLGILKREKVHFIDEHCYDGSMHFSDVYNSMGLLAWEQNAINKYFQKCRYLLVMGAGGGREILALRKFGYDVDGFECNPKLLEYANKFLAKEGITANMQLVCRDRGPLTDKIYDGAIIGWGSYTSIMGRKQRISFLKEIHTHVHEGSPILVSFSFHYWPSRRFKIITTIGNIIRWALRREYLEVGDDIFHTKYEHFFYREEIASELKEGGFKLESLGFHDYGHAVGIAI